MPDDSLLTPLRRGTTVDSGRLDQQFTDPPPLPSSETETEAGAANTEKMRAARWRGQRSGRPMGPQQTRRHHRALALQALYRGRGLSRADLARQLGLTKVTISDLVADLLEEGLVLELGTRADSRRGKPATVIDINRSGFNIIGLDLSDSDRFFGVVTDLDGTVLSRAEREVIGQKGEAAVEAVEELLDDLVQRATQEVLGVGVGSPGIVNDAGVVLTAPNLGWRDLPLQRRLRDRCGLKVTVANDANVAVVGENTFGGGGRDLMLVRIGRGVGSGVMIEGRVVGGASNAAGEIGHVVVGTDPGAECACGNHGCLETWLAIPRIEAALGAPDADRAAILAEAGHRLGIVLAPIASALDLSEIVLAGPSSYLAGPLLDEALKTLRNRTFTDAEGVLRLRTTALGNDLVVLGAVVLVLRDQLGVS